MREAYTEAKTTSCSYACPASVVWFGSTFIYTK